MKARLHLRSILTDLGCYLGFWIVAVHGIAVFTAMIGVGFLVYGADGTLDFAVPATLASLVITTALLLYGYITRADIVTPGFFSDLLPLGALGGIVASVMLVYAGLFITPPVEFAVGFLAVFSVGFSLFFSNKARKRRMEKKRYDYL